MSDTSPIDVPSDLLPAPSMAAVAVRTGGPIVTPAVQAAEAVKAMDAYHEMCRALLDNRTDYQKIGKKDFPKKSAWRKLATAFNCSATLVERVYERDAGNRIIRAEVVMRASAPNGRTSDGLGACEISERCCPKAWGDECTDKRTYHDHCPEGCTGFRHFSKPGHDLPATAMTRATNRAYSDLFGMGEVSAEEVEGGWQPPSDEDQRNWYELNGWTGADEEQGCHESIVEQAKALVESAQKAFGAWYKAEGISLAKAITRAEYDKLKDKLEELANGEAPTSTDAAAEPEPEAAEPKTEGSEPAAAAQEGDATAQAGGVQLTKAQLDAVADEIKAMSPATVDAELTALELPTDGQIKDRRQRLAKARVQKLIEAPE